MHAADRSKSAPVLFLIDTLVVGGSEKKTVAVSVSGKRDEWLRRWRLDPSAFIVGSIARLRKEKNHQDLIRALERLVAQGVHAQCLIAGDGPERNALRGMAADLGVEKRVVFAGDLTDVRPALLATSSC